MKQTKSYPLGEPELDQRSITYKNYESTFVCKR